MTVLCRASEFRQCHNPSVLHQGEGLAGVEEEGSAGSADVVGNEVSSKGPLSVLLCRPVVALLGGIKCFLLPGTNLIANLTNDNLLHRIDGGEVETDG